VTEPAAPLTVDDPERLPAPVVLTARSLTRRFGSRTAVRDVDFEVAPGERVALIGPNGAGKTTLLSMLAGVLEPTAGSVERTGRRAGWVPQKPAVYAKLTVRENLTLFARLERVPDVAATVERMLDQTGLRERADDELARLSGGNQQRVNIALGLLGEPPALLLDEPSSALDPVQRERLWELLGRFAAEGTAVVFSTHNVAEVERHADRVVVLVEGATCFDGSPAALRAAAPAPLAEDFEAVFVAFLRGQDPEA
jgi:ABC-2 type transport system ATP-binding protein